MASNSTTQLWIMRAAFPGLALVIIFFHLLPLDTIPRRWAPPDLLLAMAFAWSLRRPDYVPTLILALTLLVADLMFQRPPGLLALLVLLGCEVLKIRSETHRDNAFVAEWLAVAAVLGAIIVLNRLVLGIMAVQQAPLALILIQMLMTIVAYPLVALISQSVFGVRRIPPVGSKAMRTNI
jgi:rod shape-determining protein MreD